jgi:hypothetical protein
MRPAQGKCTKLLIYALPRHASLRRHIVVKYRAAKAVQTMKHNLMDLPLAAHGAKIRRVAAGFVEPAGANGVALAEGRTAAPGRLNAGRSSETAIQRHRHPRWEDAMESNSVPRSLGIAGVLALGSIVIARAQQQPAPPASEASTPPPPTTAQASASANHLPYLLTANAQWPEVDCGTAKLTTTASQPRCQRGPVFETTGSTLDNGTLDSGGHPCAFEGWNVSVRSPTNFGFAQLINVRALVYGCGIRYRQGGMAEALKGGGPFPTNGTGWSEVSQRGDIYTARFTSAGGENCKAFAKFGPPWASGFVWAVHGWLCGVQGNSVQDRDCNPLSTPWSSK